MRWATRVMLVRWSGGQVVRGSGGPGGKGDIFWSENTLSLEGAASGNIGNRYVLADNGFDPHIGAEAQLSFSFFLTLEQVNVNQL